MNNLKSRVSLVLAVIMISLAILPVISVNAADYVMTATATRNGSTITTGQVIKIKNSDTSRKINVSLTVSRTTGLKIGYSWNGGAVNIASENSKTAVVTIPQFEVGSRNYVQIEAIINNYEGTEYLVGNSNVITIYFDTEAESTVETVVSATLKNGSTTLNTSTVNTVSTGANLTLTGKSNVGIKQMAYRWDNNDLVRLPAGVAVGTITVPTSFASGSTHTLKTQAIASDDTVSPGYVYTIKIPDAPIDIDDELIIEPWMKETSELDTLSVSLRNDSEEDKANKNIYMLDEEVTYYVDYKNGGKDITSEVKLVLELPLNFSVVDAFGGNVDTSKKTITWVFPEGLEEEQSGTKVVVIKYTSLGKASVKAKTVYPVADIYKNSKVVDSSAVINLIFKDEDTEINEDHYPYMFGDEEAPTFRPDDTITRAEGALVLTRIFGMNTSGTIITSVYPDLNQTYVEAQKAIVAATSAGLINGYSDGYYRPNQAMTRAEFMKILAANVELDAEEEDIRGLEFKESEDEIKKYKDPTRQYTVNGTTVSEHWASPYVTLLARINMTSVTEKNKDLRLDEYITRAEVAQLVNFYLLRAPAKITSKTTTGFTDVSRNHKLFSDIVEATRAAHTYTLTVEGTEIAE